MPVEHQAERRVMLLRARLDSDLEKLLKYAQTADGRPMFHIPLTDEEQLERWLNPETRLAVEEGILRSGSPKELRAYRERMLKLQYEGAI